MGTIHVAIVCLLSAQTVWSFKLQTSVIFQIWRAPFRYQDRIWKVRFVETASSTHLSRRTNRVGSWVLHSTISLSEKGKRRKYKARSCAQWRNQALLGESESYNSSSSIKAKGHPFTCLPFMNVHRKRSKFQQRISERTTICSSSVLMCHLAEFEQMSFLVLLVEINSWCRHSTHRSTRLTFSQSSLRWPLRRPTWWYFRVLMRTSNEESFKATSLQKLSSSD